MTTITEMYLLRSEYILSRRNYYECINIINIFRLTFLGINNEKIVCTFKRNLLWHKLYH